VATVILNQMLDLRELQLYIESLQEGVRLDDIDSLSHVKIMAKVREIFATPELLNLIDAYQITLRGEE
jgi:hypothetical protein